MITVKIIGDEQKNDINIPNEPFSLFGKMIPSYAEEKWTFNIRHFEKEEITQMRFPDENYDFDAMKSNHVFIGAYDGCACVGLAILKEDFFKYMYLYDLKVNGKYRGKNIGKMLIEKAKSVARSKSYNGIYTHAQDNNLGACLFYVKSGFYIGGFDTNVYKGTNQEGKSDITFYLDC